MKSNRTDFTAGADLPRYTRDGKVPFGFNLDGRRFEGIPEEFSPAGETRRIDADTVFSVITGKTPDGLLLRAECTEYTDYPVVSWVAYVTNCGKERSAVVSGLSVDVSLSANGAVLEHGNGDTFNYEGYTWYKDAVGPDGFEISPCGDGTSCNGAFPYMRFLLDGRCVNAAVGWTGTWSLKTSARDGRLDISVSQKRFNTYLEPGETVRTPMLVLQACQGGEDRARNLWRGWYFRHVLPDEDGAKLQPKLVLHTFGINNVPEFCGITVENQLRGIRSYVKRGLRPDVWWIDAGWYPCDNKWYEGVGSWYFNPETLPDGIGAVGRQAEDLGIDLLLWLEPESE